MNNFRRRTSEKPVPVVVDRLTEWINVSITSFKIKEGALSGTGSFGGQVSWSELYLHKFIFDFSASWTYRIKTTMSDGTITYSSNYSDTISRTNVVGYFLLVDNNTAGERPIIPAYINTYVYSSNRSSVEINDHFSVSRYSTINNIDTPIGTSSSSTATFRIDEIADEDIPYNMGCLDVFTTTILKISDNLYSYNVTLLQ